MGSLWASLRCLIRAWLGRDVIRSSRTDCAWLSLKPPCVTIWQGERIEVLTRTEQLGEEGITLHYECLTPRGREILVVWPGSLHHPPRWEWREP